MLHEAQQGGLLGLHLGHHSDVLSPDVSAPRPIENGG